MQTFQILISILLTVAVRLQLIPIIQFYANWTTIARFYWLAVIHKLCFDNFAAVDSSFNCYNLQLLLRDYLKPKMQNQSNLLDSLHPVPVNLTYWRSRSWNPQFKWLCDPWNGSRRYFVVMQKQLLHTIYETTHAINAKSLRMHWNSTIDFGELNW